MLTWCGRTKSGYNEGVFSRSITEIMADISPFFDKALEQKEFSELADAPVSAIQGLSAGDAEALKKALGIETVRDLAENKFVAIAQAVVALSAKK